MTVNYVHIRNGDLMVYLQGHSAAVPADQLHMERTELVWPQDRLVEYHERLQRKKQPAEPTFTAPQYPAGTSVAAEPTHAVAVVEEQSSTDDIFAQAMG